MTKPIRATVDLCPIARWRRWLICVWGLVGVLGDAVGEDRLDNFRDWGIYRGDKKANQYSELNQINAGNVKDLAKVWEYHHGDPKGPSMYSNPIIVGGLMYFTTPTVNAVALDAETGDERWVFESAQHRRAKKVFRGRNRGMVYWEDEKGGNRRLFHFVKDEVFALDPDSGALISSFGAGGKIDLRLNLPVAPEKASVEVTTPGIVFEDVLVIGSRVPEGNESTPGDIRGYDALSGEFRWIFHTVPQPGELGYDTWEWEPATRYGGANPWGGFSLDEERGWVFAATGCAAGDFVYGGSRKGANLFSNSVLALDARTGERQWHYQTIHHDIWDYDNPPAPVLASITQGGRQREVAVQFTKMGLTFVLDRETGEPVFPVEERPVPPSDVPGEEAWPTQPFPTKPPPLNRLVMHEADVTNISPVARAFVLEEFRKRKTGYLYTPASLQGTITTPGHQGGAEWGGAAFDPKTGVIYVNINEIPTINRLEPIESIDPDTATPLERGRLLYSTACVFCHGPDKRGNPPLYPPLANLDRTDSQLEDQIRNGKGIMPAFSQFSQSQIDDLIAYLRSDDPLPASAEQGDQPASDRAPRYAQIAPFFTDHEGYPAISPPWGTLNAIDLNRGEILWKVPLGEYPELVNRGIRNTGTRSFGGPILTAGNVLFIAGTADEKIRAFDKFTGQVLWEYQLPAGGYATPSTYSINGRQFVVIAAGGGGKNATKHGDSIVAFALPDGGE